MSGLFCWLCAENLPREAVLDHLERIHVGTKEEAVYKLCCGTCEYRTSEAKAFNMIEHCFRLKHSFMSVQLDWNGFVENETSRIRNLIGFGLELLEENLSKKPFSAGPSLIRPTSMNDSSDDSDSDLDSDYGNQNGIEKPLVPVSNREGEFPITKVHTKNALDCKLSSDHENFMGNFEEKLETDFQPGNYDPMPQRISDDDHQVQRSFVNMVRKDDRSSLQGYEIPTEATKIRLVDGKNFEEIKHEEHLEQTAEAEFGPKIPNLLEHREAKPRSIAIYHSFKGKKLEKSVNPVPEKPPIREEIRYKCHDCQKEISTGFRTKSLVLLRHSISHTVLKFFECQDCSKEFSIQKNIAGHMKTKGCKKGARGTMTEAKRSALRDQLSRCFPGVDFEVLLFSSTFLGNCEEEGRRSQARYSFKKRVHAAGYWDCTMCSRNGFQAPGKAFPHILNHLDLKPYKCESCGQHFGSLMTFDGHLQTRRGQEKGCSREHCQVILSADDRSRIHQLARQAFPYFKWDERLRPGKKLARIPF